MDVGSREEVPVLAVRGEAEAAGEAETEVLEVGSEVLEMEVERVEEREGEALSLALDEGVAAPPWARLKSAAPRN